MDEHDRGAGLALHGTKVGKQRGDLAGDILVDRVDANEGIEDEESGAVSGDGGGKPLLIISAIEAESVGSDDPHVELVEVECVDPGQGLQASTYGGSGVLGSVEQDGGGSPD